MQRALDLVSVGSDHRTRADSSTVNARQNFNPLVCDYVIRDTSITLALSSDHVINYSPNIQPQKGVLFSSSFTHLARRIRDLDADRQQKTKHIVCNINHGSQCTEPSVLR